MLRLQLLIITLMFVWFNPVQAYEVFEHSTKVPYDVYVIGAEPPPQQIFVGELTGFPEVYEINSIEDFELTIQLRALPKDGESLSDLNLIIVKKDESQGVIEIARIKSTDSTWQLERDSVSGLHYRTGAIFSDVVTAGTYQIEVSNPSNTGKYILVVGSEPQPVGFFSSLENVGKMYVFYDRAKISMLRSPMVYYPVGILLLCVLIGWTWHWQRKQQDHVKK